MNPKAIGPAVMALTSLLVLGFLIFCAGWILVTAAGPDNFDKVCGDLGNTHVAVLDNDHRVCIRGDKVVYRG